jgi:23S rRNA (cytidine1920-2'-O)/16S rRNA (cytidine1409-2'-O)-methyltransferase
MNPPRPRLDQALVARGLAESRAQAQALVMAGKVFSGERRLEKAGHRIGEDQAIEVRGAPHPWVSRGGLKLDHGLSHFSIPVEDAVALDIGASTGGFTDVLLARGAARVTAVDVGRGQLAWKLRQDPRVVVLEGVNARYLTRDQVPDPVDLVVCDASFIGLELVKGGVVRDTALHEEVVARIRAWLETEMGWSVLGVTESPIRGAEGNREFLICARNRGGKGSDAG